MRRRFARVSAFGIAAALLALTAGCGARGGSTTTAPKGGEIGGVQWIVTSIAASKAEVAPLKITAEFAGGGVSGFSGVNTYSGPASAKPDGSFQAGPLASTLMAGPPAAMAAERLYLDALAAATSCRAAGGKLTLYAPDGKAALTFDSVALPALKGSSWEITGYNNGNQAVVSLARGSAISADFGTNLRLTGSSGVNKYAGDYQVNGDRVTVGALASTRKTGPPELTVQEAAYLKALQSVATWEIAGDQLTMRDASGATQVTGHRAAGK
jgi:heat shock protein HslJ